MSSWPPHLPIAITASRARPASSPTRWPGHGERGVEGAGGQVGQLGRGVVDAEVVGQVAGGEPQQHPAVLDAQRVDGLVVGRVATGAASSGSAPTARSSPARTA